MFEPYAPVTVQLHRRAGVNESAEPCYDAAVPHTARVLERMRVVRTPEGTALVSDTQVYLAPGTDVTVGDAVTVGDLTCPVLGVARHRALDDEVYVVAHLGRETPR